MLLSSLYLHIYKFLYLQLTNYVKMERVEEENIPGDEGCVNGCWDYILHHKFLVSSLTAVAMGK